MWFEMGPILIAAFLFALQQRSSADQAYYLYFAVHMMMPSYG